MKSPHTRSAANTKRSPAFRRAWWGALLALLSVSIALAEGPLKPEYVLVFVPVSWSGTMDEFDRAADAQAQFFIERSGIGVFANVQIVPIHEILNAPLDDPNLPDRVVRFALPRESGDRYIGLTDGDLVLYGWRDVVGWTQLGGMAVVCEAPYAAVTAHELGHTYNLCDEYNYEYWLRQSQFLGECPNPYPPDCPHLAGVVGEVICDGLPASDGSPSIMGPAIGPQQKYNDPSLTHLHTVFASMFGTPVGPTPTLPPGVTPPPTATPQPSPTPSPTPQPQTLVVSSEKQGRINLYVVETDGGRPKQVTTGQGPDVHGVWSPDGASLVYASAEEGSLALYLVAADGGEPSLLTAEGRSTHATWSPNGDYIVFASDRAGNWDLYLIRPDGSDLQQITHSPANEDWPAWSPQGDRLAYASDVGGDWEIYHGAYDPASHTLTDIVRLTTSPGQDTMPAWSPDGQKLAFSSERDGFLQIYVMPTSADALSRVTLNRYSDWGPVWLDDRTILFQSFREGKTALYTIHPGQHMDSPLKIGLRNAFWPAARSR